MDIYCATCPVVEACGEDGIGRQGVWGGVFRDEKHAPLGPDADPKQHGGHGRLREGTWGAIGVRWRPAWRNYQARARYRDLYGERHDVLAIGKTEQAARDKLIAKLERRRDEDQENHMARNLSPQGDSSQGKVDSDNDGDTDARPTDGDPPVKDNARGTKTDQHGHVHIAPSAMD